ncbi:MAG: hypothetical protein JHC26_00355 [Thermofilum sp.]|jgi:hypothetical protein|uniref:hypothetical protein n=1 Tax=Thermofilum sp. TaxID=1961369 RepID=UPI0025882CF2|nr:hypothetical protein [Thermofilum sp.]MCI4407516.1 hypothetical protein [Thermofilum sp.]
MDVEGIAKIEEAESKVSQLDEKLKTTIQELQALKQEKLVLEQNAIIASVASDLAETQKEKLMEMVSPYRSIKDLKVFEARVEALKESTFKVDEGTPGLFKESTVTSATDSTSDMDENVLRYAQFMAKNK